MILENFEGTKDQNIVNLNEADKEFLGELDLILKKLSAETPQRQKMLLSTD